MSALAGGVNTGDGGGGLRRRENRKKKESSLQQMPKSEHTEHKRSEYTVRQRYIDYRSAEHIVWLPDLIIFKGQSHARQPQPPF